MPTPPMPMTRNWGEVWWVSGGRGSMVGTSASFSFSLWSVVGMVCEFSLISMVGWWSGI